MINYFLKNRGGEYPFRNMILFMFQVPAGPNSPYVPGGSGTYKKIQKGIYIFFTKANTPYIPGYNLFKFQMWIMSGYMYKPQFESYNAHKE